VIGWDAALAAVVSTAVMDAARRSTQCGFRSSSRRLVQSPKWGGIEDQAAAFLAPAFSSAVSTGDKHRASASR